MDLNMPKKIICAMQQQITTLSRRDIIEKALKNSCLIIADNINTAIEISNQYAPEHLMLQVKFAKKYVGWIQNAGSVFLGNWAPITAGDYASGTNHVLPTDGYAKSLSGLSVRDFMKTISVQKITRSGLKNLASTIKELTDIEGLDAHQRTIEVRLGGYNAK
jgi:histidinol dehydrogenase